MVASTGSFRKRLPVAAKIALLTAGTIAEVPASPVPPGGSELCTNRTRGGARQLCRRSQRACRHAVAKLITRLENRLGAPANREEVPLYAPAEPMLPFP